ncbi:MULTISPECIES: DUF1697 domain-containing protein [unclassified Flavobacterium]|uniref:DUF1697 domain-containing protein n=1 Tax=unclassified Flavobacterium TaxID=196869 RepID=UPI00057FF784|nr:MULTISPECIES: DUF1697 domain-containing protein [unclassified Flavobacterium]KIA99426.1 hypothetical protein OA93_04475 [Flavobacterium sp. KMS]MEA9415628.1 DUF1697 domain-containing protein [Flavobacterium sp. PL02]
MTTHLALLRGINVSGHNMIKMEALKTTLEAIGFKNVQTYIQSGNVFVDTDEDNASKVGFVIKQEIFKVFGHEVPIVVINKQDLEACFKNNPFLKEKDADIKKLYVAFISIALKSDSINDLKISQFKPDEASIDGNRIFIKYAVGAGKTRFDQKYIEKKLNVTATIRNWNTVTQLLKIYEEREV